MARQENRGIRDVGGDRRLGRGDERLLCDHLSIFGMEPVRRYGHLNWRRRYCRVATGRVHAIRRDRAGCRHRHHGDPHAGGPDGDEHVVTGAKVDEAGAVLRELCLLLVHRTERSRASDSAGTDAMLARVCSASRSTSVRSRSSAAAR